MSITQPSGVAVRTHQRRGWRNRRAMEMRHRELWEAANRVASFADQAK